MYSLALVMGLCCAVILSGCTEPNPVYHDEPDNGLKKDGAVTQQDGPVTQQDGPVTQQDGPVVAPDWNAPWPDLSTNPCPMGLVRCGKDCVDLNTNPQHCGKCGNQCPPMQKCDKGKCQGGTTTNGCQDGTAEQTFQQGMVGCAGKITWDKRHDLCASTFRACKASEWVQRRGGKAPSYHYWTNDNLRYGGSSNHCYVTTQGNGHCPTNQPMRVCHDSKPKYGYSSKDPLGNYCNWYNCGYGFPYPNQHFGGCKNNPTAGTICCP